LIAYGQLALYAEAKIVFVHSQTKTAEFEMKYRCKYVE